MNNSLDKDFFAENLLFLLHGDLTFCHKGYLYK